MICDGPSFAGAYVRGPVSVSSASGRVRTRAVRRACSSSRALCGLGGASCSARGGGGSRAAVGAADESMVAGVGGGQRAAGAAGARALR